MTGLDAALSRLAEVPRVLVATDFDGTLAPLVVDPSTSRSVPGGVAALTRLAALDGVTVAVVSGRDLDTLRTLTEASGPDADLTGLVYVGSHGAQTSLDADGGRLNDAQTALLDTVTSELRAVADRYGARVETKPTSAVLHTRGLPAADGAAALAAGEQVAAAHADADATPGKDVLEMAVTHTDKGSALRDLASALGVGATLYLGDDVTDEKAFTALDGDCDVTVKVGGGESAARFRVADEHAAVAVLSRLADLRGLSR